MKELDRINLQAPNIMNICIDSVRNGDGNGRLFHCYAKSPTEFENELQLLRAMEKVFDKINYPQAATEDRSFRKSAVTIRAQEVERVMEQEKVVSQSGKKGTFVVHVQYRQNATWQGQVVWAEKKITKSFRSALELLKLIDSALDEGEQEVVDETRDIAPELNEEVS